MTTEGYVFPSNIKISTRQHYLKIKKLLLQSTSNTTTGDHESDIIYHRGAITHTRDDTDVELDFRQESNFFYLSGVESAGYHIVIHLRKDIIYLVPPTVPASEQLWKGTPDTHSQLLDKYDVDHILPESQLNDMLNAINPKTIYTLNTTNTSAIPNHFQTRLNRIDLLWAISEARLIKLPWEISLLRYAAHISSHAHIELMSFCGRRNNIKKTKKMSEAELEARFRWVCSKNGLNRQCYIPIVASGPRAATLHYTDNDKWVPDNKHTLMLIDAGGEYRCYGSDVTRTFPVKGKFSKEAKTIYNIVLKAQTAVLSLLKPGVYYRDMHNLVVYVICSELVRIGILIGEVKELVQLNIYRAFYFHGTGHSVGIDCHDVGGKDANILDNKKLSRTRKGASLQLLTRPLEENMVVTVEPGLYFNNVSIDIWTNNPEYKKYFDMDKINQYRVIGGVRIEDTVLITKEGIENFTIAPKTVEDIEALMNN